MNDMVQIVKYVSECDVIPVLDPMTREEALRTLRHAHRTLPARKAALYDLTDAATGRFTSWAI